MKLLYILGTVLILWLGVNYWSQLEKTASELSSVPQLILSVGEQNPTTNPKGLTDVKLTITNESGDNLRYDKSQLDSPGMKVFKLFPGEIVTQLDVKTSDQMHHRLYYPKLNSPIILDTYYADWFGEPDSDWPNTWFNKELTGDCNDLDL